MTRAFSASAPPGPSTGNGAGSAPVAIVARPSARTKAKAVVTLIGRCESICTGSSWSRRESRGRENRTAQLPRSIVAQGDAAEKRRFDPKLRLSPGRRFTSSPDVPAGPSTRDHRQERRPIDGLGQVVVAAGVEALLLGRPAWRGRSGR